MGNNYYNFFIFENINIFFHKLLKLVKFFISKFRKNLFSNKFFSFLDKLIQKRKKKMVLTTFLRSRSGMFRVELHKA